MPGLLEDPDRPRGRVELDRQRHEVEENGKAKADHTREGEPPAKRRLHEEEQQQADHQHRAGQPAREVDDRDQARAPLHRAIALLMLQRVPTFVRGDGDGSRGATFEDLVGEHHFARLRIVVVREHARDAPDADVL
jgi:hypothetical protein